MSELTTTAERVVEECRAVARAIVRLGRCGTAAEIAALVGLDRDMVIRRLRGASLSAPGVVRRYFLFDNISRTWGLTEFGRQLAKGK